MEAISEVKLPSGVVYEVKDAAARQAIADIDEFEPMSNFEINDTINLIFG